MTGIRSYSPIVQSAWAVHEAFRRLGFKADDIYFVTGVHACGKPAVFVMLRTQDKEFRATVAHMDGRAANDVSAEWRSFVLHIDAALADQEVAHEVFDEKISALGGSVQLVTAMMEKGFVLPGKLAS